MTASVSETHPPREIGKKGVLPSFLIAGTPRSGTTLIQRLVCELPGVRVPPETHFFRGFAQRVLERRRFPLEGRALIEELERFASLKTSDGLNIDVGAIMEDVGGRCDGLVEMFGGVVRHLAGPAKIYGEKTPPHLRWWRPLTSAIPELKIVAVVREPRAVVASNLKVPWRTVGHVAIAQQWEFDQHQIRTAHALLGSSRVLRVTYEDAVSEPDEIRRRLAAFLGVTTQVSLREDAPDGHALFLPWETWKESATGPILSDRIEAWRSSLTPRQAAEIIAICRREMKRAGYGALAPSFVKAQLTLLSSRPSSHYWRARVAIARIRQIRRINRMTL